MTLPKIDGEQRAAAFNRGNHFRRIGEFDKAMAVYERIVREDNSDAEAHWCCALCRFGIEYVEDPATYEWMPTCHRASFDSFLEDVDYLAAVEYSDGITRRQYQKDGAKIAEVQRNILAASQSEAPFDVFLCYKESDDAGNRTVDSTLAQDIYYQLTEKGYRVFFARITLEDKAGSQYEPYIFAALNSAKVMVAVGTKPEHFNAVWVKNEWSRYLALMRKDRKKLLIPCYRDMDPYNLPEQLSVLQSYDMGKIGFIQDLIRGVSKVIDADKAVSAPVKETVVVQNEGGSNLTALLKRGNMALEDCDWKKADEFFEQALNIDAECAEAYFGKALAQQQCSSVEALVEKRTNVDNPESEMLTACEENTAYIDAIVEKCTVPGYLYGNIIRNEFENFDRTYLSYVSVLKGRIEDEEVYFKTDKLMSRAVRYAKGEFANCINRIREQIIYILREHRAQAEVEDRVNVGRITAEYANFLAQTEQNIAERCAEANSKKEADEADRKRKEGERDAEQKRLELEHKKRELLVARNKKVAIIVSIVVVVAIAISAIMIEVIIPAIRYKQAEDLLALGNKKSAAIRLGQAGDYRDAYERSFDLLERETISASASRTVALKSDGTVLAVGYNSDGQCDVRGWSNIVAIAVGSNHTVGLKSDGTVVAVGSNSAGQCDVSDWNGIKLPKGED